MLSILNYRAFPQINVGGTPLTYDGKYSLQVKDITKSELSINSGKVIIQDLDKINEKKILKEIIKDCESCRDKYYGKEVETNIDFFISAHKIKVDNGDEIWLLNIKSDSAEGYQFLFDEFYLPEQCKLFFYNEERNMSLGAFTSENNQEDNEFVTQFINGNSIFIELYIPKFIKEKPKLSVNKVVYIFDDIFRKGPYSADGADVCHINTICPQGDGLRTEIKSVALILERVNGAYWGVCTGTLINKENDYADTDKPYFLTANHCYQLSGGILSDVTKWVFLFRHETAYCSWDGSEIPDDVTKSAVGAEIISRDVADDSSIKSDYLLLKLNNTVGEIRNYDISFAGWDGSVSGYLTTNTAGIHHPNGDIKKISISNSSPVSTPFSFTGCPGTYTGTDHHLQVIWDEGITAPGSSGSPLFNQYNKLIGVLSGGVSFCQNEPNEPCPTINGPRGPDYYGKFSQSWINGSLTQYLTPKTGLTSLAAYEPPLMYDLSLSMETNPVNVFLGASFKVKGKSNNGETPITWYLWINKTSNDFKDYNYGSSYCYNEYKTTSTRSFESTISYTFATEGNYKCKLYALDASGRQSTITSVIVVSVRKDPCIYTHLYQTDCAKQIDFPMGTSITLTDFCYVVSSVAYESDQCHWSQFIGSAYVQPKYQGISRLTWFFDDQPVANENFNTTWEHQYSPGYPITPTFYYQTNHSHCFDLSSDGIHTIRLDAYGGRMSTDGYQFIHPFTFFNSYSSVVKKVNVINCDGNVVVTKYSDITGRSGYVTGGYIYLTPTTSIVINSSTPININSVNQIKLNPGVQIKPGAGVSLKIIECPEIDCNCASNKSSSILSISEENKLHDSDEDFEINIHPNPTNSSFYVDINKDLMIPVRMELINNSGSVVKVHYLISCSTQININEFPSGLYLLSINYNNKTYTKKIIKE